MDFSNQVVVVTGGAQGIGKAISLTFASQNAKVVVADIDAEAAQETIKAIDEQNGTSIYIEANVSKEEDIKNLFMKTIKHYGKIDVLINNAGINAVESIYSISTEDFDRVIATNLRGTFLCSKYAALHMRERQSGAIINIASTRALMSEANTESYAASKGGIVALTHALAVSLGHDGIRVNAISPGWIEVGDWQKAAEATRPDHREIDKKQHPVGRVGEPNDIAQACLYLSSKSSGFITGQNIVIDGGMTKKMIYEH